MVTKLVVASGKSAGRSIAIKRNKLLIGRAEECDVRPLSEEVSRRHCAVTVGPADVWVEDLGSRNGTFVNGTRIEAKTRTKVADGDLIRVGSLELRVSCQTATPPKQAGDDVSRWLVADDEQAGTSDTTRSITATQPAETGAETEAGESSFVGAWRDRQQNRPMTQRPVFVEHLARRAQSRVKEKPGTLPQAAAKKADSSRDAAADALKKFFDRK